MTNYTFKNVVIAASAGAGKTYNLSERYLKLILLGEKVDSILATTFTRKAAGEIQDRILTRLGNGALTPEGARELFDELTKQKSNKPDEIEEGRVFAQAANLTIENAQDVFRQKLSDVVHELQRLRICTLDSFFMKLAGGYAFEIGLPPNWKIVEDVDNLRLLYGALLASFAQAQNRKNDDESHKTENAACTLARSLFKGELKRSVESQISDIINQTLQIYYETTPTAWARFDEALHDQPNLEEIVQTLIEEKANKENTKNVIKALDNLCKFVEKKDWEKLFDNGFFQKCTPDGNQTYYNKPIPDAVVAVCQKLYRYAQQVKLLEASAKLHTTWGAIDVVRNYFEKAKFEKGAYRFDDLARILVELGLNKKLAQLVYRIDAQTSHILLDEFQDASGTQWNIIKPFVESIVKRQDSKGSFFCVGDVKQAIYSWRGGRAEIFDSISTDEALQAEGRSIENTGLPKNYRSCQTIVDVVNELFSKSDPDNEALPSFLLSNDAFACRINSDDSTPEDQKMTEAFGRAQYAWAKRFERHECNKADEVGYWALEQAPRVDKSGRTVYDYTPIPFNEASAGPSNDQDLVQLNSNDDFDEEAYYNSETSKHDAASKQLQATVTFDYTVKRIVQLRQENPNASIGVLPRTNHYIAKLVSKLKEALKDTDFEISEEGGSPLTDAPAVNAALSVLQVAAHTSDHVASFHIATVTPLAERFNIRLTNYKNVHPQALYIRKLIETQGLGDFLAKIRDLLLPICADKRSCERLAKLVEFAYRYEANAEKVLLDDFIEAARAEKVESPSAAQLRVMSIHKSKGLEFDIVVLPELEGQIDKINDAFFVHRPTPTASIDGVTPNLNLKVLQNLPEDACWIEESKLEKLNGDVQEALSLLYVAITRPIYSLIAIVSPGCQDGQTLTFAKILYYGLKAKQNADNLHAQIIYQKGDPNWIRNVKAKKSEPESQPIELERQRPLLLESVGTSKNIPNERLLYHRETPSGGHERHEWTAPSLKATQKGTAIHACFEHTQWLDDGGIPSDDYLAKVLAPLVSHKGEIESNIKLFKEMCKLDFNKRLLSKSSYSHTPKVLRERPFSCVLDKDRLVRGTIDRLVLTYDGSQLIGADVIDFKTNQYRPGETFEQYDSQLRLYGKAVGKLYGLAPSAIKMRYVFVGEDWPDEERERLVEFC